MTESIPVPSRRLVCGVLLAGFAGPVVSACGSDSTEEPGGAGTGGSGSTGSSPSASAGTALVATSEVPVGGMVLVQDAGVIVTQPEDGTFKAFSATCTHQGNKLDDVLTDGKIHCSLHGSEFSPTDGSVEMGPATRGLPEIGVRVQAGKVVRAG